MDFYATGINKLISHCQKNVYLMIPVSINEDVFYPSYNDLKLMVWNNSYVWTKLIVSSKYILSCEYIINYYIRT